jgi:hypothetical protein
MEGQPATPAVRRFALAMLKDAVEVFYGRAAVKGKSFERDRTWTLAWFFSPERYAPNDPCSFDTVCGVLGLDASAVRRELRNGRPMTLKGLADE